MTDEMEKEERSEGEEEGEEDSQGGSSGDDLDQLLGDDGLSGTVEGQGQLVNHLGWRRRRRKR